MGCRGRSQRIDLPKRSRVFAPAVQKFRQLRTRRQTPREIMHEMEMEMETETETGRSEMERNLQLHMARWRQLLELSEPWAASGPATSTSLYPQQSSMIMPPNPIATVLIVPVVFMAIGNKDLQELIVCTSHLHG